MHLIGSSRHDIIHKHVIKLYRDVPFDRVFYITLISALKSSSNEKSNVISSRVSRAFFPRKLSKYIHDVVIAKRRKSYLWLTFIS